MRMPWSVLAALMLAALPSAAQPAATPEEAAGRYVAAMRAGNWPELAAQMHPEALRELKTLFAGLAAGDSAAAVLQPIFGVATAVEFDALPATEVYVRLLRAVTRASPQVAEAMRTMEGEVIGSVAEGADTAHVVYRLNTTIAEVPMRRVDVLTFRRAGGGWAALLTADLRGLARTLSAAMGPR